MCTKKEAMEEITRNLENRQDADTGQKGSHYGENEQTGGGKRERFNLL